MPTDPNAKVLLGKGGVTSAGWHSIEPLLHCPKKYQLQIIRGIREPQVQVPSHFAKGLIFAAMRARWFARKFGTSEKTWQRLRDAAREEAESNKLPMAQKDIVETEGLMQAYINHWLKRPLPQPVAAEYKLTAQMGGEERTARLDDLSYYPEAGGALCIGEAKTTSGDISGVVRQYELHGQTLGYKALYKLSKRGEARFGPVSGVMLDVIQKPSPGKRPKFERVAVEIPDYAVEWYVDSMDFWVRGSRAMTWDSNAKRNPALCTYMAGRARVDCEFKPLCRFGKNVASKYVMSDGSALKAHQPVPGKQAMPWE